MAEKTDFSNKSSVSPAEIVATKSTNVIESYIFATSNRSLSVYSERLLMQLVNIAQCQLLGANFRNGRDIGQIKPGPLGEMEITIPIKNLLGNGSGTNYSQAKQAIVELMKHPHFVERPKIRNGQIIRKPNGDPEMELIGHQILNDCEVNTKPGLAILKVNQKTWESILDFTKGFRKYDLEAASSLKKPCSMRLFRLLSNQEYPITYTIDQLREMWEMKDKYPDTNSFIKRTIDSAKKELDECAPWSFTYKKNLAPSPEGGRKTISSITFTPVRIVGRFSTGDLMEVTGTTPQEVLTMDEYRHMTKVFGFTAAELKNNLVLFKTAKKVGMNIDAFLSEIFPKANRANNMQGYTINAIKKRLQEKYSVKQIGNEFVVDPLDAAEKQPRKPSGTSGPVTIGEAIGGLYGEPDEQ